jgi:hypothetical protein
MKEKTNEVWVNIEIETGKAIGLALNPFQNSFGCEAERFIRADELAKARRLIYWVRHVARDGFIYKEKDACARIMKAVDAYSANKGLVEDEG